MHIIDCGDLGKRQSETFICRTPDVSSGLTNDRPKMGLTKSPASSPLAIPSWSSAWWDHRNHWPRCSSPAWLVWILEWQQTASIRSSASSETGLWPDCWKELDTTQVWRPSNLSEIRRATAVWTSHLLINWHEAPQWPLRLPGTKYNICILRSNQIQFSNQAIKNNMIIN